MDIKSLWRTPEVNPVNGKARTFPILNPIDKYGRTFHLAWFGFFVAFLSWFAFPPLLHGTLQEDLKLTQSQIANSNIISLLATFVVRVVIGPLTDAYGPRYTMVGCLIVGAIPTALAGLVYNYPGLMAIRFFVGILGGTFVPCQVWTTVFYDDNVIGRVNAFAAGWGNAGGGVTFFVMPAVVAGLMQTGYTVHTSWRVAFAICPFVIIVFTAGLILVFGHDTPNGPWRKQNNMIQVSTQNSIAVQLSEIPPNVEMVLSKNDDGKLAETNISTNNSTDWKTALKVIFTFQTALVALPYLCSFGSELAVEGMISSFYVQQAKISEQLWSQQKAGNWAAMFGLLNIVTRPAGGYIADLLYRNENVQLKKYWMLFTGLVMSIFFLWIGLTQLHIAGLVGAMAVLAVFMDAANGAVFAVVPHIHVHYQGIVAGLTGACGSLGGILFNLAFRYNGTNYHKALWQIGIVCSTINILLVWIKIPSSKHK